ncbi:MAG: peptidase MA family metallohydrolase [Deltaproteobacteria bacterium]|jgi:hypothetical protein
MTEYQCRVIRRPPSFHGRRAILPFLAVLVFAILLVNPLHAQEFGVFEGEGVTVLFEAPPGSGAKEAAEIYPIIKKDLEKTLQWPINFTPTVLLVKQSRTFQRMAQSDNVVAFAVPVKNLMVIDHSKMTVDPFTLEGTMKHELCHLLLHHHLEGTDLPKWLDEGIAQWVSGGITEIMRTRKETRLTQATLGRKIIPVRALAYRFPGDRESLFLAYEESRSLVAFVIDEYGLEGLLRILDRLKDGYGWEMAVSKGLSVSFADLEADWLHHLRERLTWLSYIINHVYEILFFLGAVIMVIGAFRVFLRKRAYMREMEDDDTTYH